MFNQNIILHYYISESVCVHIQGTGLCFFPFAFSVNRMNSQYSNNMYGISILYVQW